jgi:DNA-binding beta-propeller fold protein YncE
MSSDEPIQDLVMLVKEIEVRSVRFIFGIAVCILVIGYVPQHFAQAQWGTDTTLKLVWQTKFPGDAALITPGDMAIDADGNVYVTTQTSNSVKKFDSNGNFVKQWGESGNDNGNFALALGIGVDSKSNVYVADFYNKRIQKFDSNGTFLAQWANESTTSPAFITVDSQDNIYVDEFPPHSDHYIEKFDATGKLLSEWGNTDNRFGGRIEDIAMDKDGNMYIADPILHHILKLDGKGDTLATIGGDVSRDGKGLFFDPFGVALDKDGNLYVLDSNFLQEFDPQGKFVTQWSTHGGDLDQASKITFDKAGNLYLFAKTDVTGADGNKANVFLLKKFTLVSGD